MKHDTTSAGCLITISLYCKNKIGERLSVAPALAVQAEARLDHADDVDGAREVAARNVRRFEFLTAIGSIKYRCQTGNYPATILTLR